MFFKHALVSSFLQPFGNHLSVIRFLYPYFFIHFKQCTLSQLIRLFIVVIACMGCYFTKRNLYFLSCFLHMGCVFAGQWCFWLFHTPVTHFSTPFVIIADFHSWIFVFYGPSLLQSWNQASLPATFRIATPAESLPLPDLRISCPSGVRITQPKAYLPILFSKLPST